MDGGLYETAVGGKESGQEHILQMAAVEKGKREDAVQRGLSEV